MAEKAKSQNFSPNSLLTKDQVNSWRTKGYSIVSLPEAIWKQASKIAHEKFPPIRPDDFVDGFGTLHKSTGPKMNFPCLMPEMDKIPLNEEIIKIAQDLLNYQHIRLSQAECWAKYPPKQGQFAGNFNQRIHQDYGNNTFLHVSDWNDPDAVAMILYYDDTEICGGATAVCPREGDDDPLYQQPYINGVGYGKHTVYPWLGDKDEELEYLKVHDRDIYEKKLKLYEREILPTFKAGDLLLYRLDVFHRGTPLKMSNGDPVSRRIHSFLYKRADREHILQWNSGFGYHNYYGFIEKMICGMSPLSRSVVYFPLPGNKYWDSDTNVENVKARYPGIDMRPYIEGRNLRKE